MVDQEGLEGSSVEDLVVGRLAVVDDELVGLGSLAGGLFGFLFVRSPGQLLPTWTCI